MDNLLENQLIIRCKKGDSLAFGQLVKNYRKQLFTYLIRLSGSRNMAEDLFQETLIKAWEGIRNYSHENKFSSWLFSIAHNTAMDAHRKQKAGNRIKFTHNVPDRILFDNQQHSIEREEMKQLIVASLQQLPEKQRNVFLLRQHGGIKFNEIAEITGQSLNTVLSHMHYAVKKLRKILKEKDAI